MKFIHRVRNHGKIITLHLKKHHRKYIFGILSVSLLVKGISLIVAHTLVHNLSFANILTGDDTDSIINAEFDDNELTENLDGLTDGSDTKINSENIKGGNLEELENLTDSEEPVVNEDLEEPENSTDPEELIVDEDPEEPENLTDLKEPVVSENPEESEDSTDLEEPVVSKNPEESEDSTDLEEPVVSEDSEEPIVDENPEELEEPIVDENPEEPTADENSDDFVATRGLVSSENMSEELEQDDEYFEDENEDDYIEDDLFDNEWDDDFDEEFLDDEEYSEEFYEYNRGKGIDGNTETRTDELTTFEKAFQEVAYAYYMRGPFLQYNLAKGIGSMLSPEQSTSQDYHHMACTTFVMNVYKELLGIDVSANGEYNLYYARKYLNRPEVIGYGEKSGNNLLRTYGIERPEGCEVENPTQSCIIKQLKIGDIVQHGGHSMLVYDYIFDDSGNIVDVYLLNSLQTNYYMSKMKAGHGESVSYYDQDGNAKRLRTGFSPWSNLYFTYRSGMFEDLGPRIEGTIRLENFKYRVGFKFPGSAYSKYKDYYVILRLVTTDSSGNSILNFDGSYKYFTNPMQTEAINDKIIEYSNSVESRLKYSKLYIEKTVDKKDNNVVEPNDELTYKIVIKNESNKNYETELIVKENMDTNLVQNLSIYSYIKNRVPTNGVQLQLEDDNQLQWNIGKLNSGDEVIIEYTVRVKTGHLGQTIESTGLVDNIPSGTIKNKIGKNLKEDDGDLISEKYVELKNQYTGKILINEIYKKAYGIDLGLNNLIIVGRTENEGGLIVYNKKWGSWYYSGNADANLHINTLNSFSGMVLNSYFNALYKYTKGISIDDVNILVYAIPAIWIGENNPDNKANIIYPADFKTGDILIYLNENDVKYTGYVDDSGNKKTKIIPITYENGEYAYIYIDGNFVGVNSGNDLIYTGDDRNEFTRQYYDDNNLSWYSKSDITGFQETDEFKDWLQYQTLFGKDAYVILRPSLMIRSIDYELDGGINNDENPKLFILGRDVELKEPTKTGYVFSGWYTDLEYTNQVTNTNKLTDDVVLYAKWMSGCTFQGVNMAHGNSLTVYSAGSITCPVTCITGTVTCNNGTVLGNTEYSNLSCSPLPVPCDTDFTLTSTGSHGIYESCIPYTVSNNSCTPGITVYKLTNCANGYHTENDSGCISNTKMVSCTQSGKPENSSYVTGNVQVTWNGERNNGSWPTADNCSWVCDSGYTKVGNGCKHELTTFEKAFQEVAYAYYMRGPYLHYNSAKGFSDILSPEESTSQDYHYMTCTPYVMNVYKELLGIVFTLRTSDYSDYAKDYIGKRKEVIGYGEKKNGTLYWYDGTYDSSGNLKVIENPSQSYVISQLKIGDILYYEGHAMLVYDYEYSGDDIVDVYLLHSWQANYKTKTKGDHGTEKYYNQNGRKVTLRYGYSQWSKLGYNYRSGEYTGLSRGIEGTVILQKLSEHGSALSFSGDYKNYYSILRLVDDTDVNSYLYVDGQWSGGDKFSYYNFLGLGSGTETLYNEKNMLKNLSGLEITGYSDSVESRLKYSKLYIEKTVDKRDNNIVQPSEELIYTVKIQNNSDKAYDEDLIVKENLNIDLVENLSLYSYERNRTQIQEIQLLNNGNQLQWNIGKLNSGDEVVIKYTVKVKTGHIGEIIESTGLVDNIPSGIVKNKIGKNTNKGENLKDAYNNLKDDFTGKMLINEIYKEVYGVDLEIDKIAKINTTGQSDTGGLIYYNGRGDAGSSGKYHAQMYINQKNIFSGMILNSYFNVLRRSEKKIAHDLVDIILYEVPALWSYKNPDNRANTIYPTDFKTGDILIYINEKDEKYSGYVDSGGNMRTKITPITYEDGEYAYIYIGGKFVGVNPGSDLIYTGDDRNEFTTGYYVETFTGNSHYWYSTGKMFETDVVIHVSQIDMPGGFENWLQYQTLFGKDAYVILRPSLAIRNITYELDGGTNNDENPNAFILGRDIELKEPTKTGYVFSGWYTDSEYTTQVTNINELTDDVVLYAKWENSIHELTTFEKAFQEVAYAYYMRGPYLHYNSAKSFSDILPPEESTSQDYHYMTCTPYVMNVYKELFGIVLTPADAHYVDYAKDYVGKRPEVIGYGEKSGNNLYWWDGTTKYESGHNVENPTQNYIISQLKIGDILHYAGHVMLVYDYVYDESGNIVDVYLLHSWQANYKTYTKADHTTSEYYYTTGLNASGDVIYQAHNLKRGLSPWSKLGYNYRDRRGIYEDSRIEGTVILQTLKEKANIDGTLSFSGNYKNNYVILRFVDDTDGEGSGLLNFDGQWTGGSDPNDTLNKFIYSTFLGLGIQQTENNTPIEYSDSVESRLNYSKLYIEKTVDKKDNNIVEPDDELTYSIAIKNESKESYDDVLIVKENINTNLVEYLSRTSTSDIQLISNSGNQLQWNIGKLNSGDGVIIEYTVRVKTGHLGEIIESTGLVDNIPSGTIKNKIGKNLKEQDNSLIASKYNELKSDYTGRTLINEIYRNVYGVDLGLDSLIMTGSTNGVSSGLILYNGKWNAYWNTGIHATMYINSGNMFSGMILNSYFNTLRKSGSGVRISQNGVNIILHEIPALWLYENPDNRANTIYPTDFQTGDILIYTNENDIKYALNVYDTVEKYITYEDGEYAYIYIDGKFVGVNLGNDGIQDQKTGGDDRNVFITSEYYEVNNLISYTRVSGNGGYLETGAGCGIQTTGSFCIKKPTDELIEFLRYQSLFGKDAYVILRPSLMIRNITYELDGGTNNEDNPTAFILGRDVELKEPTKTGYVFSGWYTDSEYTTQVTNTNELTDDVVLYAKWENNKCEFNGSTVNHGETVTGYRADTVQYGETCESEVRTCTNGELSGTYQYGSCTVQQPDSCTFNGNTVNHGDSVTGYENSTVPYGETCESEIRTCTNGELSGTYQYGSCTVQQPDSCTFNGNTISHGDSVTGYENSTVPYGEICESEIRTCTNGELSGTYQYGSCTVQSRGLGEGFDRLRKYWLPIIDNFDSYYDLIDEESTGGTHNSAVVEETESSGQMLEDFKSDIFKYNSSYSNEMNEAYQFAYHYGITTTSSIKDANMYSGLTRIAMAKMLSNYAENILGMNDFDTGRSCKFNDVSIYLDEQYGYGVIKACQLGIMGINMKNNNFDPYGSVTRAQFATALSRLLYGTEDGEDKYYTSHISKLKNEGIITDTDPTMKELRGYVMIMLMRSVKN